MDTEGVEWLGLEKKVSKFAKEMHPKTYLSPTPLPLFLLGVCVWGGGGGLVGVEKKCSKIWKKNASKNMPISYPPPLKNCISAKFRSPPHSVR